MHSRHLRSVCLHDTPDAVCSVAACSLYAASVGGMGPVRRGRIDWHIPSSLSARTESYLFTLAAGSGGYAALLAAWGQSEVLGRLDAMRMLMQQPDRSALFVFKHLSKFNLKVLQSEVLGRLDAMRKLLQQPDRCALFVSKDLTLKT